jgi:hypothetical protein
MQTVINVHLRKIDIGPDNCTFILPPATAGCLIEEKKEWIVASC